MHRRKKRKRNGNEREYHCLVEGDSKLVLILVDAFGQGKKARHRRCWEITFGFQPLDHVCDALAALHPRLDQLGKHLEDSLTGACALLLENGWCNSAELELEVVPLPIPPPLLKIRSLHFRSKRFGFDGRKIGVI